MIRFFKSNLVRFVVIFLLVFLTVAIVTAIGSLAPRMRGAIEILENNRPDRQLTQFYGMVGNFSDLADGVERISFIFPAMFIVVTLFVVFMSITRLIAVERRDIGTLRSLGVSKIKTAKKYIYFVFFASFFGASLGIMVGHFGIHPLLFRAISSQLDRDVNRIVSIRGLAPFAGTSAPVPIFGISAAIINIVFALIVVIIISFETLRRKPADLLRPKSPKVGKKTILEYVPFFWKSLGTKYRSTFRNVFRYKVRFFMSIITMVISTILVFLGISLTFVLEQTNPEMMDFIRPISAFLAASVMMLGALVFYNITLINIEERIGEIATLMVLGYRKGEVVGYVFREILILTIFGVALGLPLGFWFMDFMFEFLRFGNIDYLNWYVWIITGLLSFAALGLAFLLLFRKIHKIDMNASLKFKTD